MDKIFRPDADTVPVRSLVQAEHCVNFGIEAFVHML